MTTEAVYCNATFDTYLCWPYTKANTVVRQSCPNERLSDPSNYAYRKCGPDGLWLERQGNERSARGWTNFTPCFPTEVQDMFEKSFSRKGEAQSKYDIAYNTRVVELCGYSISAVALIISLVIFFKFRSLKNKRTMIHKCMFWTLLAQSLVRIIIYVDQLFIRGKGNKMGIENSDALCISSYVTLEYFITATFVWHLIEGVCLYEYVTRSVMRADFFFKKFFVFGWGVPAFITLLWVLVNNGHYRAKDVRPCWFGYNFHPIYWLLQGPRIVILLINFFFLVSIMITVIRKLQRISTSELERAKRTVRAGIILVPLLGIPNICNMYQISLDVDNLSFAMWFYFAYFLLSCQGLYMSILYCFMNREVQLALRRAWLNYNRPIIVTYTITPVVAGTERPRCNQCKRRHGQPLHYFPEAIRNQVMEL